MGSHRKNNSYGPIQQEGWVIYTESVRDEIAYVLESKRRLAGLRMWLALTQAEQIAFCARMGCVPPPAVRLVIHHQMKRLP